MYLTTSPKPLKSLFVSVCFALLAFLNKLLTNVGSVGLTAEKGRNIEQIVVGFAGRKPVFRVQAAELVSARLRSLLDAGTVRVRVLFRGLFDRRNFLVFRNFRGFNRFRGLLAEDLAAGAGDPFEKAHP